MLVRFRRANQQSGWIPADNTRRGAMVVVVVVVVTMPL